MKLTFFASTTRRLKNFQPTISQPARAVLAVVLAVLILLPSLGLTVSAHAPLPAANEPDNDYFMLYASPDGDTVCRVATAAERSELEKINPKNLQQINHLSEKSTGLSGEVDNAVTHLTIILRATTNLQNNAAAMAAFNRAAANWENVVNSPVTIFIDADFGPDNFGQPWPSGVLGSTSAPSATFSYSFVRGQLVAGANSPAKSAVYNALPSTSVPIDTGSGSTTSLSVSATIGRAIGLLNPTADAADTAAKIGFNGTGNFTFDFDRSDGVQGIDFEAVATHEIGHALGFTSRAGSGSTTPAMWDLYRFRTGTTSGTFTTATRVMTIGGTPDPLQFYFVPGATELGLSTGGPSGSTDNGGDGNQSSHWKQASLNNGVFIGIMDPRIPSGKQRDITDNDVNALNIFGFNSNTVPPPAPPPNDNFAAAQVISGCSGTVNGTNAGATKEAGEPNHLSTTNDPNGGGSRSVWYKWQAPSSSSVTFATEGSTFDTVMGVYRGTAVNALTVVGQHDDVGGPNGTDKTSAVTFNATAGTTYMIAVDGYNNAGSGGDFGSITLTWNAASCSNNAVNQIDDPTFFVTQHYHDFLNRDPDASGLAFWVNGITSCGADAACIDVKRINVSGAFYLAIEFQETGYLAYRTHKAAFGNLAGAPVPIVFSDFLTESAQIGQNVQVGVGNWQAQLEANKQAYMLAFVQRGDFATLYPAAMTATNFVTQLNTRAGGVLSAAEQTNLINLLSANPTDITLRSQVLRAVAEDQDLKNAEFNRAFVLMQYFGYLRRNPNSSPDTNFDGFNFWLTKLNQFNGDFVAAEMVKAFISSTEYRQRFGP
ncbi:MAG TPA: NF038122 family metalloprotease [Pyrinomonadaceae bacterium]